MKTKSKLPKARAEKSRNARAVPKAKLTRKRKIHTVKEPHDWISKVSGILDGPGNFNIPKGETPYERTKHLLEVLTDLPADLSTNPKYLEGFGQ